MVFFLLVKVEGRACTKLMGPHPHPGIVIGPVAVVARGQVQPVSDHEIRLLQMPAQVDGLDKDVSEIKILFKVKIGILKRVIRGKDSGGHAPVCSKNRILVHPPAKQPHRVDSNVMLFTTQVDLVAVVVNQFVCIIPGIIRRKEETTGSRRLRTRLQAPASCGVVALIICMDRLWQGDQGNKKDCKSGQFSYLSCRHETVFPWAFLFISNLLSSSYHRGW